MSLENPLWGAPRIHGELLKLGINVAQSTVSVYMLPRQGRPLQSWKTFLRNHGKEIAWGRHVVENERENFYASNAFLTDGKGLAPDVHRRRPKGAVCSC